MTLCHCSLWVYHRRLTETIGCAAYYCSLCICQGYHIQREACLESGTLNVDARQADTSGSSGTCTDESAVLPGVEECCCRGFRAIGSSIILHMTVPSRAGSDAVEVGGS